MRINHLDLIAFGPFTDVSLAFERGERDLHLVYGPNEAGKSSALRAIFACLFGIPARSRDDFVHEKKAMRVGGEIQNQDGVTLRFVRCRSKKNDLLAPDTNAPLLPSSLDPFVGGLDATTFERVWGIDHQRLIEGGAELQSLKGLTGESLFAAALGIRNLSQVVLGLEHDSREIFVPDRRARTLIRSIRKRFDEALKIRRESEVSINAWTKLQKDWMKTQESEKHIRKNLQLLRADSNRFERILAILEDIGERQNLQRELESMQNIPLLPADYSVDKRRKAQEEEKNIDQQRREALEDLQGPDGLVAQRAAIEVDEGVRDKEEVIERLVKRIGTYQKACEDLPKREGEKRLLVEQAKRLLKEVAPGLDFPDAEKLRVTQVLEDQVLRLAQAEGSLRQELESKTRQLNELAREVEQDREARGALPDPCDVTLLRRAVDQAMKQGELPQLVASKMAEARRLEDQAEGEIRRLGHWHGQVGDIPGVELPLRPTIDNYLERFRNLEEQRKQAEKQVNEAEQEICYLEQEIESVQRTSRVPPLSRLSELRAFRDVGWKLVRRVWLDGDPAADDVARFAGDTPLHKAYEASVREVDETADRLVDESEISASLEQKRRQCEMLCTKRENGRQRLEAWEPLHVSLLTEWEKLWIDRGVIEPLSPREMAHWLEGFKEICRLVRQAQDKRQEADSYELCVIDYSSRLAACLARFQEPPIHVADARFDELLMRGQQIVEAHEEWERERKRLNLAIADKERRIAVLNDGEQEARKKFAQWNQAWADSMREMNCDETISVDQANVRLRVVREYFAKWDAIADLDAKRILPMIDDKSRFQNDTRELVERCAQDLKDWEPALAVDTLAKRLKNAESSDQAARNLEKQIDNKRKLVTRLEREMGMVQQRLKSLCDLAGVEDPASLKALETDSDRKRALLTRLDEIDRRLLREGNGASVDELIEENAGKSSDELKADLIQLQETIREKESERDTIIGLINDLKRQTNAVDGDAQAAWADQQPLGCVAEAAEQAERYVRLRLASHLLRLQIEKHRAENQDPMMTKASELFAKITCGSFVGLTLDYDDKDQPRIVGVRDKAGTRLALEAFSRGTADQLYLALRLAYLQARLEGVEPMPIILDDILVDFDDDRASAALQVLADLAAKTQIILLTHHQHLRKLAHRTLDRQFFHEHELARTGAMG